MNKKGSTLIGMIPVLVMIILALLVGLLIYNSVTKSKGNIDNMITANTDKSCKVLSSIQNFQDIDHDGRPDLTCDNCVCPAGGGCNNDDDQAWGTTADGQPIFDGDGVPKGCDVDNKVFNDQKDNDPKRWSEKCNTATANKDQGIAQGIRETPNSKKDPKPYQCYMVKVTEN